MATNHELLQTVRATSEEYIGKELQQLATSGQEYAVLVLTHGTQVQLVDVLNNKGNIRAAVDGIHLECDGTPEGVRELTSSVQMALAATANTTKTTLPNEFNPDTASNARHAGR